MKQSIEARADISENAEKVLESLLEAGRPFIYTPLMKGGSDRAFFRASAPGSDISVVLCRSDNREEMEYYVHLNSFFHRKGVAVPEFLYSSLDEGLVIMEDAGNCSLYDAVRETWDDGGTVEHYTAVLERLIALQRLKWSGDDWIARRPFDYQTLRWETSYFLERFLGGVMGYDLSRDEALLSDFHRLAESVALEQPFAMHRDFQSQNIFIRGSALYFLDFQGARTGPLFYDTASLLMDPYVHHGRKTRDELFARYCIMAESAGLVSGGAERLRERYARASMQRLMQALGAFGFLGLVKGKRAFLQHIRPALSLLLETVREHREFPKLTDTVKKAHDDAADRDDIP
jgi:aminoglycoside/choline kinase family phosphotransferase